MRNRPHIVGLALAIVSLMLMVAVPHHHHAMGACLVQEQCHKDGRVNDNHTRHPAGLDSHHFILFAAKQHALKAHHAASDAHPLPTTFFWLGLAGVGCVSLCGPLLSLLRIVGCAPSLWQRRRMLSCHGLRAPPHVVL